MITRVLLVLMTVFTGSSVHQNTLIEWHPDRKLTWSDFKAVPDPNSTNAALTISSINIEFGYSDQSWHYSIKCRFDKNRSWMRVKSGQILTHEQGHFDIAELYARKLNKALKEYRFRPKTINRDVNSIYEKLMAEHHKAQSKYDRETDFSRDKSKQAVWTSKIAKDLQSLDAYAGYGGTGN
ncbi:MAG: DUF922 domain-containing protein [Chitinophagaceae bacterium]